MRKPTKLTEDEITDIRFFCVPKSHSAGYNFFARKYAINPSTVKLVYTKSNWKLNINAMGEIIRANVNSRMIAAHNEKQNRLKPNVTDNNALLARLKASKSA
jgi:hypothetical protein